MLRPRALVPGSRVALVAPASRCPDDEVRRGEAELRRLGFDVVCAPAIRAGGAFTAGTAAERARDFLDAWTDPSIAGLIAVRGGYGSAEILPLVDAARFAATPKLFVGYSDTTALLSWLTCHVGITALHGPMVDRRLAAGPDAYDPETFLALCQGRTPLAVPTDDASVVHDGTATGLLFGGTMTQLAASLGTPYAFDPPDGCVLLLEDVNERPYRLHRLLTQLRQAGLIARAAAIVVGELPGCDEPSGGPTALDAVRDALAGVTAPILCGVRTGHTSGRLLTVPLGTRVRVTAGATSSLLVEESPVV